MQQFHTNNRIVLAGFMGVGKSSVGKLLARKLGYTFVDSDAVIVKQTKLSIADFFAKYGESAFRKLEVQVVLSLLKKSKQVIALGGGAILDPKVAASIMQHAQVFLLWASLDHIMQRLVGDKSRPLLLGDEQKIRQLYDSRQSKYFALPQQINTETKNPNEVAGEVMNKLKLTNDVHQVELGAKSYPIFFGHNYLAKLPEKLSGVIKPSKLVILTNTKVAKLYLATIKRLLTSKFNLETIIIPDGERYKNLNTVAKIYDQLVALGADRNSAILALGGGVVGDIAGFVAGTYLRGIPFVQVPTTLLAQVDSSVGGKTGVDLKSGKNLVGVFNQPRLVFIDTHFLSTLAIRELRAGMAEVIKTAVIQDKMLLSQIDATLNLINAGQYERLRPIVRRCCEIKAAIVSQDEFETKDLRALLNFGHTLGHAIEAVSGFKTYLHGEAVAMGMVYAANLSVKKGYLKTDDAKYLTSLISKAGLPTIMPKNTTNKRLKQAINSDKKRVSQFINFVYLSGLGKAFAKKTPLTEVI